MAPCHYPGVSDVQAILVQGYLRGGWWICRSAGMWACGLALGDVCGGLRSFGVVEILLGGKSPWRHEVQLHGASWVTGFLGLLVTTWISSPPVALAKATPFASAVVERKAMDSVVSLFALIKGR